MMKFKILLLSLSLFISTFAWGDTVVNPWIGLNLQKQINSEYTLLWENQYRLFDGEYSELQWRLGLIKKINNQWSIAGGGFSSFNKEFDLQEVRIWQQVIYSHPVMDKFNLFVRYRQEQRQFTLSDELAHRSRIQVRLNYNLNTYITPYVSTEMFIGLNDARGANFPSGYNQNRSQVGAAFKISPQFSIESSYMRVYSKTFKNSSTNNVWWTSFQFRF